MNASRIHILCCSIGLALVQVIGGCSSEGNTNLASREPPVESQIERVEFAGGTPAAVVTKSGEHVPFEQGVAAVGDTMALAMPEGHVEYHRTPAAILEDIRTAKSAYVDAQTGVVILVDGFAGESIADAQTGRQLLTAVTCTHPDCPGNREASRPNVFALPTRARSIRTDDAPYDDSQPALHGSDPCPHCGRNDMLESYRTAEQLERQIQLEAELAAASAARRAARSGKVIPSN